MWSIVLGSTKSDPKKQKEYLNKLITTYWMPVYTYIRISWKRSNEDAKDLAQEFFTQVMEKDSFKELSPERGRFRSYIKVLLKNFLINRAIMDTREKRGGKKPVVSIHNELESIIEDKQSTGLDLFDKGWAKTVILSAIQVLTEKLRAHGKEQYMKLFNEYYYQDISNPPTFKDLAGRFNIKEWEVKNQITYVRKMLKKIIVSQVTDYVIDSKEAKDEVKYLLSIKF
jgi:RNA polymerase sigma-70 factor (ECF subfamily)